MQVQGKEVVLVEGQLRKIVHAEGEGELPQKGQEIYALYRGTLQNGSQFDSNQDRESPFTFVLGQGRVIKGWDVGFASMRKGERATLICSPDFAYGDRGSPPKIPPKSTLNFEVELLDFKDKKKEKWQFSDEEKLAEALRLKESGNHKLKQGNAKGASDDYKEGIDFVEHETLEASKQLLKTLQLNIAQAFLKLNKNSDVIDYCAKVIKEQPGNLKALYRRGVAYSRYQDFDRAQTDFKELIKLEPQNVQAKKELAVIAHALKQLKEKEKKVFGNIFSKGGLYDDVKTQNADIKPQVKKVEGQDDEEEIKQPEEPEEPEEPEPTPVVAGEHEKSE